MFSEVFSAVLLANTLFSALTSATQVDLSTVGPLTPLSSKTKICNILDYGGIADNSTDIGPAIELAFSSCAITGAATIYIPPGSYSRKTCSPIINIKHEKILIPCSPNWRSPKQRLRLRYPNRRPHNPNVRRLLRRQRLHPGERLRHRSLLLKRARRHQRSRLHHPSNLIRPERAPLPLHLLHLDLYPRHHLR